MTAIFQILLLTLFFTIKCMVQQNVLEQISTFFGFHNKSDSIVIFPSALNNTVTFEDPLYQYYAFTVFNKSFTLLLNRNNHLVNKQTLFIYSNKSLKAHSFKKYTRQCFYFGHVLSEPDSSAAVSSCNGLYGIISFQRKTYYIRPVYFNKTFVSKAHYLITFNKSVKQNLRRLRRALNFTHYRKKKQVSEVFVKLGLYVDSILVNKFNNYPLLDPNKIEEYILILLNSLQFYYIYPKLRTTVWFELISLIIYTERPKDLVYSSSAPEYITSFCFFQVNLRRSLKWNIAIMLTGLTFPHTHGEILGIGLLGTVCLDYGCAVITTFNSGTVIVLTHELGHVLGLTHDADGNPCSLTDYIMAPAAGLQVTWSNCSIDNMNSFLGKSFCLAKQKSSSKYNISYIDPLPGQVYSRKTQCKINYGWNSSLLDSAKTTCKRISCYFPPAKRFLEGAYVLEGTSCGNSSWCINQTCEPYPSHLKPVRGQWSDWIVLNCEHRCYVENTVSIRISKRLCNNPLPLYGGERCKGSDLYKEMCSKSDTSCVGCQELKYHTNGVCSLLSQFIPIKSISVNLFNYTGKECYIGCEQKKSFYTISNKLSSS